MDWFCMTMQVYISLCSLTSFTLHGNQIPSLNLGVVSLILFFMSSVIADSQTPLQFCLHLLWIFFIPEWNTFESFNCAHFSRTCPKLFTCKLLIYCTLSITFGCLLFPFVDSLEHTYQYCTLMFNSSLILGVRLLNSPSKKHGIIVIVHLLLLWGNSVVWVGADDLLTISSRFPDWCLSLWCNSSAFCLLAHESFHSSGVGWNLPCQLLIVHDIFWNFWRAFWNYITLLICPKK